jgi:type I restriction enzyme S subunit
MTAAAPQNARETAGRYRPYPRYKDSGIEWLGEIPAGWRPTRLRFCATVNPTRSELNGLSDDTEVSFVPMEAVCEYGGLRLEQTKPLAGLSTGYTYFRNGDVLVAKITPCFENGKGSIARDLANGVGFGTTELHVLRPMPRLDPAFLFYLTISHSFRSIGAAYMYGAGGQKRVPDAFVRDFRHPIPPLDEQRAIAAFLDRETARIDALIEKKRQQIELLREKRTALISHAVTKGLDPNVPMKDSGIAWLGEIPAHWNVKRIKHLGAIRYGLGEPPEYVDDGLPFIRATDIKRGKIDLDNVRKVRREDVPWSRRPTLQIGEILVVRSGAYTGDSAIVTEDVAGCIAGFDMVLTITKAHAPFVAWVLLSKYMLQGQIYLERMRAAQPHLNAEELGEFVIVMPPLAEQRQIADTLSRKTEKLEALADKINSSIHLLREYRTALISAAVTGKIDIRQEAG